jgi:glycosyltransferase involved in cell wall biosynthesis
MNRAAQPISAAENAMGAAPPEKVRVSAVVHTLNEEHNLEYCLRSLGWVHEIFIIDSGSTDRTLEIARRYTPHVVVRQGNRGTLVEQRNWALQNMPFTTDWAFVVDADEVIPEDLAAEIAEEMKNPSPDVDGYWLRSKIFFMGRWIKHASMYPTWVLRLFRHKVIRYEKRAVNAHPGITRERERFLKKHFLHDDHDGMAGLLARLPEFGRLEAIEYAKTQAAAGPAPPLREILRSRAVRRRWMKTKFIRMPLRPVVLFTYLYIVRGGFLDGYAGFVWVVLKALQEWFLNLYLWEKRRNEAMAASGDNGLGN